MDFKGKVAIVTGGAQGIGKAMSEALLNIGMKLLICDVNESSAKSFLGELSDEFKPKVIFQKCDVTSVDEFRAAFERAKSTYGRIDVVLNNAGICNEAIWHKMIDVNFIGVIHGINLAFEYMGKHNGGSGGFVINTASSAGIVGFDLAPVYSGTKHAVVGLTKSYGANYHLEKTGVTVNAVCPGPINTTLFHLFPKSSIDDKRAEKLISNLTAISPDEVGKGVVKLLRDGKNGALLNVDEEGIRYEAERPPLSHNKR